MVHSLLAMLNIYGNKQKELYEKLFIKFEETLDK